METSQQWSQGVQLSGAREQLTMSRLQVKGETQEEKGVNGD